MAKNRNEIGRAFPIVKTAEIQSQWKNVMNQKAKREKERERDMQMSVDPRAARVSSDGHR